LDRATFLQTRILASKFKRLRNKESKCTKLHLSSKGKLPNLLAGFLDEQSHDFENTQRVVSPDGRRARDIIEEMSRLTENEPSKPVWNQ